MFPYLGIRHVGVPPRVKFTYVYMPSLLYYSKFHWILRKTNVFFQYLSFVVKSQYYQSIAKNSTTTLNERYLEKIAEVGVDPVTIPDEQFNSDCLPPIEATDLLSYLVLETSFFTKQQFKAYKSLEACNFMVSGFITSIQGCIARLSMASFQH